MCFDAQPKIGVTVRRKLAVVTGSEHWSTLPGAVSGSIPPITGVLHRFQVSCHLPSWNIMMFPHDAQSKIGLTFTVYVHRTPLTKGVNVQSYM